MEALPDNAAHILIVDDDQRIRDLLARYLFDKGFRVTTAVDAASARAVHARPHLRRGHPRRHDARRKRPRSCPRAQGDLQHSHLHDDRAGRSRAARRGPGGRRRRLRGQALRAARAAAAAAEHPAPGPGIVGPEGRDQDGRLHLPRGARRAEAPGRDHQAHRARARPAAPVRPAARACRLPATSWPATIPSGSSERAIDVQINRLRRKIETDPTNPVYLQTVRGKGYILHTD